MKDRVCDMPQTIYPGPYPMRHAVCPARLVSHDDGVIGAQARHAVFRTRPGRASEGFNMGRDVEGIFATKEDGSLKFRTRLGVFTRSGLARPSAPFIGCLRAGRVTPQQRVSGTTACWLVI